MSEPRIAVKVAEGRFITCFPMPHKNVLGLEWKQHPWSHPNTLSFVNYDGFGTIMEYISRKGDE